MHTKKTVSRRGFTLVELIVVLVILAALAALLVPALTGYIDKANKQKVITEARAALTAAQTVVSEAYGRGQLTTDAFGNYQHPEDGSQHRMAGEVMTLAELGEDDAEWRFSLAPATGSDLPGAKVAVFEYCNKQYRVTYRAVEGLDSPAGWSEPVRAENLPEVNQSDEPPFLSNKDFDPEHFKG